MKNNPNEPENVTKRREKQVLDNFKTENELLLLRSESQETKYKEIDTKMMTEIEKQATGQSHNYLTNMWQEDCRRNEEISKKRWQNKNLIWLNKYEENFRTKYQNKNPFVKEPDETDRAKTYAEISAEQPKARRQRPNPTEKQRQEGGQNKDPPLPQRTTGGRRNTQLEGEATRQTYPRQYQESPTLSNRNTTDGNDDIRTDNSTQVTFLGRGQGRGRGKNQRPWAQTPATIDANNTDINIINLSNRKLTEPEVSLLTKGLKFTPVPKSGNKQELTEDLNAFNRKLRLAEYFEGMEDEDISLVRNKSNFTPPDKRKGALDEFIDTLEKFPKTTSNTY